MTRLILIASVLFLSVKIINCDKLSPSETLNYFCPCRSAAACTTTFGDPGPVFQDILKVIPMCKGNIVRCCSKDVLFTAVMIILNDREIEKDDDGTIEVESKDGQKQKFLAPGVPAQQNGNGRFFGNFENERVETQQGPAVAGSRFLRALTGRSDKKLPEGLVCVPLHQCGNVYGTNGQHVRKFGFISPLETGCLANAGNILCVIENRETSTPSTNPSVPAFPAFPAGRNGPVSFSFATNGNGEVVSSVNNNGKVVNSVHKHGGGHDHGQQELPCTQPKDCPNIYGTDGSHFDRYGVQQSCPSGDQVRCVQSPSSQPKPFLPSFPQLPSIPGLPSIPSLPDLSIPVFTPPTSQPQVTAPPKIGGHGAHGHHHHHQHLPCVPQQECQVIYGTLGDHFNMYGIQEACKRDRFVRCVTIKEKEKTTAAPVSVDGGHGHAHGNHQPLPCVPQHECQEIYGIIGAHFDRFGIQQGCPADHLVRCVKVGSVNTPPVTHPTPPLTHPTPPITHSTPPSSVGGLPVGPVAPSVSIIGPQPIYVSYNNIKGPSVGSDNLVTSDGQVDSSGIHPSQESQINLLLQGLKEKLRNILHG